MTFMRSGFSRRRARLLECVASNVELREMFRVDLDMAQIATAEAEA